MAPATAIPGGPVADEELMRRTQAGDETAFGTLMERWEAPLKRTLARLLLNASEAGARIRTEGRRRFVASRSVSSLMEC